MTRNRLLDAVDALTVTRNIPTVIEDDEGRWLGVHTEKHAPLLDMLEDGISSQGAGSASSDPGIPIDAAAIELVQEMRGIIRSWCEALEQHIPTGNVKSALRRWYQAHVNALRSGEITDVADLAVTKIVEGWVKTIEAKFDPPDILEWTDPCPGWKNVYEGDEIVSKKRCGARRVVVERDGDKVVQAAIFLNFTALHAACSVCRTEWDGKHGLMQLRYDTNLVELERESEKQRDADILRHAVNGPEVVVEDAAAIG